MSISSNQHQGLVLEDYFHYMQQTRSSFQLPTTGFWPKQIEAHAGAGEAIETIIADTVHCHGGEIYSKPHPLLGEANNPMYAECHTTAAYSGHRIDPLWVNQALS